MIRYELGGVPLPYSSKSPLYKRFFPGAPTKRTADEDEEPEFAAFYKPINVPACPSCKGKRVFELQLVPSLISVLRPQSLTTTGAAAPAKSGKVTEDERRKELARIAKGLKGDAEGDEKADVGEMEWGNIMVFGCENDCVGYGEEYVAVEWEAQLSQPVSKA
jgi:pre-rRNA-processing protein TSR4